jgi:hypothetical protein
MDSSDQTRERVLELLTGTHREILSYLDQFSRANGDDKPQLSQKALELFAVHSLIMNEIVYPWIKVKKPEIANLIDRCIEQQEAATVLARSLVNRNSIDSSYEQQFAELARTIKEHTEFEQNEVFVQLGDIDVGSLAPLIKHRCEDLVRQQEAA